MNYFKIKKYDISNGSYIHTTIYFSGCAGFNGKHCDGCFNHELWDFKSGKPFDDKAKEEFFSYIADEHVKAVSILGGEPMQQGTALAHLLKEIKETFPNKPIWLWTGYYKEQLNKDYQHEILSYVDYLIDGPFEKDKSGLNIKFRGSKNQTIWTKSFDGTWRKSELND